MKAFSLSTTMRIRPTILLFGDSITEFGFGVNGKLGWASLLSAHYTRRADVLSRGFSGYNTQHALDVLPSILGTSSVGASGSSVVKTNMLFCTVFFGANDCSLPTARQHLDIEEFDSNIRSIVSKIRRWEHQEHACMQIWKYWCGIQIYFKKRLNEYAVYTKYSILISQPNRNNIIINIISG